MVSSPSSLLLSSSSFLTLFSHLRDAGKLSSSCVVTNSSKEVTDIVRRKYPILDMIPNWVTRDMYDKAKPAPDGYTKVCLSLSFMFLISSCLSSLLVLRFHAFIFPAYTFSFFFFSYLSFLLLFVFFYSLILFTCFCRQLS